ncbi:MAG: rod shape-determining protein MreD [Pseudomonadota bacterium]
MTLDRPTLSYWLLYLLICSGIFFVELLPLQTQPGDWSRGDPLVPLTMAWMLRRPDYLPLSLAACMFFLGDLLLQRPPGLFAGLALMGCLFLRARGAELRRASRGVEFAFAAGAIIAIYVAYRLILFATFLPAPSLSAAASELVFTLLYYPIFIVLIGPALGLRHFGDPANEGAAR